MGALTWGLEATYSLQFMHIRNAPFVHNFGGFVRNVWRVCSQFWLSVRNFV